MPADERGVRVVCAACGQHEPLDDDRPMIEQLRQFRARHDHVDADRRLVPHG